MTRRRKGLGPVTLAELEARAATQDAAGAGVTRARARALAKQLGVPCPAWASKREREPHAPTSAGFDRYTSRTRAIETAIPDALRAWARRYPGTVIHVGQRGVALHVLGAPVRKFPSVTAAVAAVSP